MLQGVKAEPSDSELIRVGDIETHYGSSDERRDTNSTDREIASKTTITCTFFVRAVVKLTSLFFMTSV
jgi:hypothetical protein